MILLLSNIFYQEAWVIGNIVLLVLCFLVQLLYYAFINRKSIYICNTNDTNVSEPVSVIIAAKNEAANLRGFLPKILEQDYPNFDVIVINDYSNDDTLNVLEELQKQYENLIVLNNHHEAGKKQALSLGIEQSKYDVLLFIDADCYPISSVWISSMVSEFSSEKSLILAYGAYEKKVGFANAFIRYDTQLIAKQYFAASSIGKSYMGVGRNMAYRKELWRSVEGFESHKDLLSGDDDLFISKAATSRNVGVAICQDSITYSIPSKTVLDYFKQKTRHISTSKQYSVFAKIYSSVEVISRALFYLSLLFTLCSDFALYVIPIFLMRLLFVYFIERRVLLEQNSKLKFYFFVLFDTFAPMFYLAVVIKNVFNKNNRKW